MLRNISRVLLGAAIMLCAAGTALAQGPAPKATPTPAPAFTYSGFLRAYYFTRTNPKPPASGSAPNQASFNPAISLHGAYDFGGGFSAAGTYLYADPFNKCADPASHLSQPCAGKTIVPPGQQQQNNPDDTLPGYRLSTLYEAYLQYKDPSLLVRAGDQVINTPWANASDSRLKPVAFRGGDLSYKLDPNWTIEGMYMNRWEDRVQSDFVDSTILTENAAYPDAGGVSNTGLPKFGVYHTNGFYYGRVGYGSGPIAANFYYYNFDQIANAFWADAKFSWKAYGKPFIALQGGSESSTGNALAGKINSQVLGIQGGYTPWKNVDLTAGFDYIPMKTETVTLPAGIACNTKDMLTGISATHPFNYFLPTGGTPVCTSATPGVAGASATIYYGGWASPYTDSYATDQLFSTSISQGMVDRRSAGSGVKVGATLYQDNKQIRLIASHAWYVYGNGTVGLSPTQETDIDGTYFFSKVGKGPYHGWSLRHRYAERSQLFTAPYGGAPDFKYNRTQLEYDF
jgi:hypothetical protein